MYYDTRLKYATGFEKARIRKLEKEIDRCVTKSAELVKSDFGDYVESFGITGPMAHGEGTVFFSGGEMYGSDVDLGVVSKFRSKRREDRLRAGIEKIFSGAGLEVGVLCFSPSIFKRPDLMFYQYCAKGKVLFGRKLSCRWDIPVWEAAKALTSRSGMLFDSLSFKNGIAFAGKFPYSWSKALLGAGEALLIMEGSYALTFTEGKRRIQRSRLAKKIPGLPQLHAAAYEARFRGKISANVAASKTRLLQDTGKAMEAVFEQTAKALEASSGKPVEKLSAPLPAKISTRLFYFFSSLKRGKLKVPLSEPLVMEFAEMQKAFGLLRRGRTPTERQRRRIVHLWKHAERFWLPY